MVSRRDLLRIGLGLALCAPAIVRTPGLLMPIRPRMGRLRSVGAGGFLLPSRTHGNLILNYNIFVNKIVVKREDVKGFITELEYSYKDETGMPIQWMTKEEIDKMFPPPEAL